MLKVLTGSNPDLTQILPTFFGPSERGFKISLASRWANAKNPAIHVLGNVVVTAQYMSQITRGRTNIRIIEYSFGRLIIEEWF